MRCALACIGAVVLCTGVADASVFTLANVPDFDQHFNPGWSNYCAPTAGADVAYYFSQSGYPLLRQGNPIGPGAAADMGATAIIGGNPPAPPPPAGSMASLMGTTLNGGTTAIGLSTGLDAYLENNWDGIAGGTNWNTAYVSAAAHTGAGFWSLLQNEIDSGSGVILTIAWLGGLPGMEYDLPEPYIPSTSNESAMGHAVTLVGYDNDLVNPMLIINDPANNGVVPVHNWAGEYASHAFSINPMDLTLNLGGAQATVYGAVVTNIPAPWTIPLLGAAALVRRRRRRG